MEKTPTGAAHLVVTSPPYPMIEMWDASFGAWDPSTANALRNDDGPAAFEAMHRLLDRVWAECYRALCDGGIACINIGDAVRTIKGEFRLYPNHARIIESCLRLGFSALPAIIWRKQTNAPNKFMGSGMTPPGAYVTLEHEFILVLRKGNKRLFKTEEEKRNRRESAFFWEERNNWFSDVWFDLKGASQRKGAGSGRDRSGAFPFELAYRLVNMFSVYGDTVIDPFLGTGVTTVAAMASARNSEGYEIDSGLSDIIRERIAGTVDIANERISRRLADHIAFAEARIAAEKTLAAKNIHYGFPCVSRQETELMLRKLKGLRETEKEIYEVEYEGCVE